MITRADIDTLTVPERIQLIGDIWDSITTHPEQIPMSEELSAELDRRLEVYESNPSQGSSWAEVRASIETA